MYLHMSGVNPAGAPAQHATTPRSPASSGEGHDVPAVKIDRFIDRQIYKYVDVGG